MAMSPMTEERIIKMVAVSCAAGRTLVTVQLEFAKNRTTTVHAARTCKLHLPATTLQDGQANCGQARAEQPRARSPFLAHACSFRVRVAGFFNLGLG